MPSALTDEQIASARRMRRGRGRAPGYTWSQIADHFGVSVNDVIRCCDRREARRLNLLHGRAAQKIPCPSTEKKVLPPLEQSERSRRVVKAHVTYQQVLDTHAANPDWDSHQIAAALGCLAGYVRATAQRRGITLPVRPRILRVKNPSGAKRVYRLARNDDEPRIEPLGLKAQLVEDFYDIFEELFFPSRAVFEQKPSLVEEFKHARRNGQTLTGFLMGDPLPHRSALAQKKA